MKPIKYYQIVTPDANGIMRPFEVDQFGVTDPFFKTMFEADEWICEHLEDAQEIGSNPPEDKVEVILSVIPVYLCRYKKVK